MHAERTRMTITRVMVAISGAHLGCSGSDTITDPGPERLITDCNRNQSKTGGYIETFVDSMGVGTVAPRTDAATPYVPSWPVVDPLTGKDNSAAKSCLIQYLVGAPAVRNVRVPADAGLGSCSSQVMSTLCRLRARRQS